MTLMVDLPNALADAGCLVRTLDGWETPQVAGYKWREPDDEPAGVMWHHTASSAYTPNRDKANLWVGLSYWDTDRLYQSGGGFPVVVMANAYPAPISSGYGVRQVLEDYVKADIPFEGRQTQPDDPWAGNTHYVNIEVVLDGTGTQMDEAVWDTLATVGATINDLYGWSPARHIGHAHHTRRKIDLRDGRFPDANQTMIALRDAIEEAGMSQLYQIGIEDPLYEEISWLLFILQGGNVDPNKWSSQITEKLPWKTNVRLPQVEDFDLIGSLTGMNNTTLARLKADGLYKWGKEIAALREYAYGTQWSSV